MSIERISVPRKYIYYIFSIAVFLILWELSAQYLGRSLLPGVAPVLSRMIELVSSGTFFTHLLATIRRVVVGFGAAYAVSIILGILMGRNETIEYLFEIPVLIGISVPGLAVAVISIVWFGLSELTAYVSVFILATPLIIFNFWQGAKAIDENLIEMAEIFSISRYNVGRHIILPSLLPHLLASARFGLAVSWKIIVIVELLGLTSGVGYKINSAFQQYSVVGIIAWTLNFTIVMMIIEFGILKQLEKRATKWRVQSGGKRT